MGSRGRNIMLISSGRRQMCAFTAAKLMSSGTASPAHTSSSSCAFDAEPLLLLLAGEADMGVLDPRLPFSCICMLQ